MSLFYESDDLSDHFEDDEIMTVLPPSVSPRKLSSSSSGAAPSADEDPVEVELRSDIEASAADEPPATCDQSKSRAPYVREHKPSLGLLLKIRTGINRVLKRQKYYPPCSFPELVESAWNRMCPESITSLGWTREGLTEAAEGLATKILNLNGALIKELNLHPLLPPTTSTTSPDATPTSLSFDSGFISRVREYHASIERPEGTFSDARSIAAAEAALRYPRERCIGCGKRQQMYCGQCGGIRMPLASEILPPRVYPPFDILLIVHWHESLHKCTGVHSAVLCTEGTVSHAHWLKEAEDGSYFPWLPIVESLDASRDVLLFPSPDATFADAFDWGPSSVASTRGGDRSDGAGQSTGCERYRLVVLEATWNHAKWISKQIATHRKAKGLPPLRCVALKDVVGQYWRFHEEGHSALSTIEAIAYTASAAGMSDDGVDAMLALFRVQKGRVLLSVDRGEKVPRAMCVGGVGEGSWDHVHIANPI